MEYLWKVLGIMAVVCAVANIAINILVIFRVKMTFSCDIYITEYVMSAVILLALLRQLLSGTWIVIISALLLLLWCVLMSVFRLKGLHFIRVFGIKKVMHEKLRDKLEKSCANAGLDRTSAYIYGGDAETPCNMIIFRHADSAVRKSVTDDVNKFMKNYACGIVVPCVVEFLLDAAVIFIVFSVLV